MRTRLNRVHVAVVALLLGGLAACAGEMAVFDAQGLEFADTLTLTCLQGVVNREGPRLYLAFRKTDFLWADYYAKEFGFRLVRLASRDDVVRRFARDLKGYAVWDPEAPDTANLAATLAGLEDCLVVAPDAAPAAKALGLKCTRDFCGQFVGKSKPQVYAWAFESLWPRCSREVVGNVAVPAVPSRLDVSRFLAEGDELFVRFEDSRKADGMGAKLRRLRLEWDGGEPIDFRAGSNSEKPFLVDGDRSWLDREGDRIADRDQHWVYRFKLRRGAKAKLSLSICNEFLVRAAAKAEGPFETLLESQGAGGAPNNEIRDYLVARRAIAFDLSSDLEDKDEFALKDRFLGETQPLALVLGWHTARDSEGLHVAHASRRGDVVICSLGSPNLSLHSRIRASRPLKQRQAAPADVTLERDKVYVCFILSDGDALHWVNSFQGGQWLREGRGKVPFGWELQPLLAEMGQGMLQYYYQTATPQDCLVASASGIGYSYPEEMSDGQLKMLLQATRACLEKSGLRTLTVLTQRPADERIARAYSEALAPWAVGCVEGYARTEGPDYAFGGMPWIRSRLPRWSRFDRGIMRVDLVDIARLHRERPLFVPIHVFCYSQTIDDMAWLAGSLDPKRFKVVRPDEFLAAAAKHYAERAVVDLPPEAWFLGPGGFRNRLACRVQSFRRETAEGSVTLEFPRGWEAADAVKPFRIEPDGQETLVFDIPQPRGSWHADQSLAATIRQGAAVERRSVRIRWVSPRADVPEKGLAVSAFSHHAAAQLNHRIGSDVADPEATEGTARAARPGTDEANLHLVFGPYERVPKGRYLAGWRLEGRGELAEKPLATLDVYDHPGGGKMYGSRVVKGSDFAAAGRYEWFFLPVVLDADATLEYRVLWHGGAELRVDQIGVWKTER